MLKKAFVLALMLLAMQSVAQPYRRFRFGYGASYDGRFINSLDFSIGRKLAFGLRLEWHNDAISGAKGESAALFAQYYLKPRMIKRLRPYMGLGVGRFHEQMGWYRYQVRALVPGGAYLWDEWISVTSETNGGFLKMGMDYKHVSLVAEYNLLYRRLATIYYTEPGTGREFTEFTKQKFISDNYFTLKLGIYFGGGLKRKK